MKLRSWMAALSLTATVALSACATAHTSQLPTLASLQSAAASEPKDAHAASALALGELVLAGGDNHRAQLALIQARKLTPTAPDLLFAQGLLADIHGQPSAALDAYIATIEQAVATRAPAASLLVEVASYAVLGQVGLARGFAETVRSRLTPLMAAPQLSLAARAALVDV
ncbi:MAG: hypothetical protein RL701_5949, partial [Pseudomonadota bacterium]